MPGSAEPGLGAAVLPPQQTAAVASGLSSLLQKPRHAAEVSAWLSKRANASEVQRFDRLMGLVQQVSATSTPPAASSLAQAHQRPASSLGFSATQHSSAQRQQQRTSDGRAATAGSRPASARPAPAASWHHTATTQAAAAAAAAAPAGKHLASGESSGSNSPGTSPPPLPPPPAAAAPASTSVLSITTAQAFHGLKDLYPDLWAATTPICRPAPAPNRNFTSAWGEALRRGAAEAWAPFLTSSYQAANATVAKPTDEFAVRADDALLAWAAKQKLYGQELLTPQAAAAVALLLGEAKASATGSAGAARVPAALSGAAAAKGAAAAAAGGPLTRGDKKELLELLRQLAAVVEPESDQSMSHSCHKPQHSIDEPETTALLKEQTRINTMGFPRKVAVKGFRASSHRPAATAAAGLQGSGGSNSSSGALSCAADPAARGMAASGKASAAVNPREETLMSNVPLNWAAAAVGPTTTSYTAAYGAHPGRSPQMCKTVFREVNVGFGSVDSHLHPHGSALFPVQQLFLQQPLVPGQQPQRQQADQQATTQRRSYQSRDAASVAASVAAAREQMEVSRAARNKSFIPLGRGGLQLGSSAQWLSSYGAGFVPRQADLSANKAMAAAVAGMFNGPTIAFGKIAGMRRTDAAGIQKFQLQQQAEEAARAAAEAKLDLRAAAAGGGAAS